MNKPQYHREMDDIIESLRGERKSLLLHSCCAPCSCGVLAPLREVFRLTVFYDNPNISEEKEYRLRAAEQKRLVAILNQEKPGFPIGVIEGEYRPEEFYRIAAGLEGCPEGGGRCFRCYRLRLESTAREAKRGGFDFFTTTLTISPLKNADRLNAIGRELAGQYGVPFLPSDFKKKNGYQNSIELSKRYGLYRQDYCGCIYSRGNDITADPVLHIHKCRVGAECIQCRLGSAINGGCRG